MRGDCMKKTNRIFYIFSVLIVIVLFLVYLTIGIIDSSSWLFVVSLFVFVPLLIAFEELLFLVKFLMNPKKSRPILYLKVMETCLAFCLILCFGLFPIDLGDIAFVIYAACLIVILWLIEGIIWYLNRRKKKKQGMVESEETTV